MWLFWDIHLSPSESSPLETWISQNPFEMKTAKVKIQPVYWYQRTFWLTLLPGLLLPPDAVAIPAGTTV